MISKRAFLTGLAAAGLAGPALAQKAPTSLAASAKPIDATERLARINKLQGLMQAQGISALLVESGSTLDYFTGIQWWTSERVTAAVLPAKGAAIVVTPAFEEPSVRETLQIEADVRPWNEHENPEALIIQALKDRGFTTGRIAIEPDVRFFIVDALKAQAPAWELVSGQGLVNACRQIKSASELALMQVANDITIAALRQVHAAVQPGMSGKDIGALMDKATAALGGSPEFSMVLLNEASAYPHGSKQPQTVREGSVILMDCGCSVHGYESDISRSWVYGAPSAKQRKVWETVKRGQEIALATARPGVPVGSIDDAVRAYYEKAGWGPGYRLPGLSHRTGHGIGMDGHESPYLVHSDLTPLASGMCFSDEPGLYIPGEFGIRLEDCWHMTEAGPKLFTPLARSIDEPV
ncbi:Xaa-Pro peptidase family protein [Asticcacaulis sp.]|uniref:M24 family metallopeptidase n=1 Tax=Asticcacaulis sp. TaxID=1872648 RepID=UPI002B522C82|nr:Xaa-Pro peptidase family protein [Asticcacaulis sp.]HTM80755.1 Xaa-Pro peptidase family protein [Asticcacaulis sp.]